MSRGGLGMLACWASLNIKCRPKVGFKPFCRLRRSGVCQESACACAQRGHGASAPLQSAGPGSCNLYSCPGSALFAFPASECAGRKPPNMMRCLFVMRRSVIQSDPARTRQQPTCQRFTEGRPERKAIRMAARVQRHTRHSARHAMCDASALPRLEQTGAGGRDLWRRPSEQKRRWPSRPP